MSFRSRIKAFVRQLEASRNGNIAMLFAACLPMVMLAVGVCVDFAFASMLRDRLYVAADTAAVGSLADYSVGYKEAAASAKDLRLYSAQQDAEKIFRNSLGNWAEKVPLQLEISSEKRNYNLTTSVEFRAKMPTTILGIFGFDSIDISGRVSAKNELGSFNDYYIVADNSPSMGLGATSKDIAELQAATPDKCAFACHIGNNTGEDNYDIARRLGISLRIDTVKEAINETLADVELTRKFPNQFRVATYSYGATIFGHRLTNISPLSADMNFVRQKTSTLDLLVTYTWPNRNWTNNNGILTTLNTVIPAQGSGSSATDTQKIVILISDGWSNTPSSGCTTGWDTSKNCLEPLDYTYCDILKARGIKIATLYTTYLPLKGSATYDKRIAPFASKIPANMKSCASPGLYAEVNINSSIAEALKMLFNKASYSTRLTE